MRFSLLIEVYFKQLQHTIESFAIVQSFNFNFDKRGTSEGFIRGEIYFVDGSILHIREFVDVETTIHRLMYVYQYLDSSKKLIFRYDDTGHHKDLDLPTVPHHKHEGAEDEVIASSAPDLTAVLTEIEAMINIPLSN